MKLKDIGTGCLSLEMWRRMISRRVTLFLLPTSREVGPRWPDYRITFLV